MEKDKNTLAYYNIVKLNKTNENGILSENIKEG